MQPPPIFDRRLVRLHRERAAWLLPGNDFLICEAASRIAEKFDGEINGKFPLVLDLGARHGQLSEMLQGKAGIGEIIRSDLSERMLDCHPDPRLDRGEGSPAAGDPSACGLRMTITADEERLPFAAASFDLITSCLNLHWVNDIPGCLRDLHTILKPGGLLIASMFGGESLKELRQAILAAEMRASGGASPRISPFTLVKDAGRLLHHAGFALPVADSDTITVLYPDARALMHDLRAMGETNALLQRNKSFPRRTTMQAITEHYQAMFGNAEGHIPATFEIITLTGWKN